MALIPLYLRFFQPKGALKLEHRTLIGIALLSVTGLDILPVLYFGKLTHSLFGSIEWWNSGVAAWVHALLWVPHHVAGLVACLTGFLVVWYANRRQPEKNGILKGVVGGLMFASALGLSIYIAFVFAVFLAIWIVITTLDHRRKEAGIICISGLVALAFSIPYLLEITSKNGQSSTDFLQWTLRPFGVSEAIIEAFWPNQPWLISLGDFLSLPVNYYLELGFFFSVGLVMWRRLRRSADPFRQEELCGLVMAGTSILICTFLRSSVISNNDLGWRGFLVGQFVLLIWGAELVDEGFLTSQRIPLAKAFIILGVAGSLYEVCMVRIFPLLSDETTIPTYAWLSPDRKIGKRTYAVRQVYDKLHRMLPESAIEQHNPNATPGDLFYGLYADRQAAAETSHCGVIFGGDPALCSSIMAPINDLFEKPGAVDPSRVDAICKQLSIDALEGHRQGLGRQEQLGLEKAADFGQ